MSPEETLVLYKEGKDAWNAWAERILDEIKHAIDEDERSKIYGNSNVIFNLDLLDYNVFCEDFIFPSCVSFEINNIKIQINANFRNCKFYSSLNIYDYIFNEINFSRTEFFNIVKFYNVKFKESSFSGCSFNNEAIFMICNFENNCYFGYNDVYENIEFYDCNFEKSLILSGTKFLKPIYFSHVNLKNIPEFDNVFFPKTIVRNAFYVSSYRALRQLASKSGDHEREIYFFACELKSRSEWWMRYWVWCYDKISDFGRSIWRPMATLFFITFISFNINLAKHEPLWTKSLLLDNFTCKAHIQSDPRMAALQLALEKSFPLISGKDEKSKQNMLCLYGGEKDLPTIPDSIALLGFFQTILSLVLLFLSGLGVRNRFRLK